MRLYKDFTKQELAIIADVLEAGGIENSTRGKLAKYFNRKWAEFINYPLTKPKKVL